MSKVSFILPSRNEIRMVGNETVLQRTVRDIYEKATGEFEVLVGFNGQAYQSFPDYPNLKVIKLPENAGIKTLINLLASVARGKYLFKLDSHCSISNGIDEIIQQNVSDDWIVTPRFKIIKDDWSIQEKDGQEEFYDYFYLSCPLTDPRGFRFKAGGHWSERTQERLESNPNIDETPQMHGSGWFMTKDRFFELGGFPLTDPYGHGQEPLWLGLRNWLKGGKLMVNKKTWYAHLHQDSKDRGYPEDRRHTETTYNEVARYWLLNKEPNLVHDFNWFVDKFMPMPSWPEDWRGLLSDWRVKN